MPTASEYWDVAKQAVKDWQADDSETLAAALAYYTVFSIAPLLVIALVIAGALFGEQAAQGQIAAQIEGVVGAQAAQFVQTAIDNADTPGGGSVWATLVSIVVLVLGSSRVFSKLEHMMNRVWDVKFDPDLTWKTKVVNRLSSFLVVLAIGLVLLMSLVASMVLASMVNYASQALPGADWLWWLANLALNIAVVTALFAAIFKYVPEVDITWSDVFVGAFVTAVLFTALKYLLSLYLGYASFASAYGAAGSLIVFLFWIYMSAQILFLGAEFTKVYAERYGHHIEPTSRAVPLPS